MGCSGGISLSEKGPSLVLRAATPQHVGADRVAPPPDVNGSGDVCACGGHTLRVGNVTQPSPALDAAELSMRWIGVRCRCNVRTGPEVHWRGSSSLCHLCFPVTSHWWAAWKPNSVPEDCAGNQHLSANSTSCFLFVFFVNGFVCYH